MYIKKADYKGRISTALLDTIISEDPTNILLQASKQAEDTIKTHVGMLYDIVPEFALNGANRNGYILGLAISIALYNIYQITDDYEVPEKVIKNHDDTIEKLELISKGKMPLDLPPKTSDTAQPGDDENASTTGIGLRRFGSAKKRTHHI